MARKRRDNTYGPSSLPELANPVDDNQLLAASTTAADQDRMSGAYDEFLFSENGLEQMPYERAVDDRLSLVQVRLLDRGRRAALALRHSLLQAEADVVDAAQEHQAIEVQIENRQRELDEQREILSGDKPGKHGLLWKGIPPEQTTIANGWLRLALPYLVFIIVGAVDMGIIYLSFFNLAAFGLVEAIMFTLPTVAVQLVFPHFIGTRISLLLHKHPRKLLNALEASILGVVWLSFAVVLTNFRMQYAISLDPQMSSYLRFSLTVGNVIMLIGLGTWLLLSAARHNPHETIFARLNLSLSRLEKKELQSMRKLARSQAQLPSLEASLDVAEEGFKDAVTSARGELAEAAKSAYRRALVNQIGNVEFSAAYLATTSTASPGRAAKIREKYKSKFGRPAPMKDDHTPVADGSDAPSPVVPSRPSGVASPKRTNNGMPPVIDAREENE